MEEDHDDADSAAGDGGSSLHTRRINISRPVYDQASFDRQFLVAASEDTTAARRGQSTSLRSLLASRCDRSAAAPRDVCRRLVLRHVPVIEHLRQYRWKSWFVRDVLAAISSGVILVPQVRESTRGLIVQRTGACVKSGLQLSA